LKTGSSLGESILPFKDEDLLPLEHGSDGSSTVVIQEIGFSSPQGVVKEDGNRESKGFVASGCPCVVFHHSSSVEAREKQIGRRLEQTRVNGLVFVSTQEHQHNPHVSHSTFTLVGSGSSSLEMRERSRRSCHRRE
jgi:hypothetical protein